MNEEGNLVFRDKDRSASVGVNRIKTGYLDCRTPDRTESAVRSIVMAGKSLNTIPEELVAADNSERVPYTLAGPSNTAAMDDAEYNARLCDAKREVKKAESKISS